MSRALVTVTALAVAVLLGLALLASTSGPGGPAAIRATMQSPLDGRNDPTAVWIGDGMLVWGGQRDPGSVASPEGAIYSPIADSWRVVHDSGLTPRYKAAGVWTGSTAIIWGGRDAATGQDLSDGAIYDPAADRWRSIRSGPIGGTDAAWTGRSLLAWGLDDGLPAVARYDTHGDTWASWKAPLPQGYAAAGAWSGRELLVASYPLAPSAAAEVAALDPLTETWRELPASPLGARFEAAAIYGNSALFLSGAQDSDGRVANAAYDPGRDRWLDLRPPEFSGFRPDKPVWSGRLVLFYGRNVVAYDPATDLWQILHRDVEPSGREQYATVWSGTEMLVWGGSGTGDGEPPTASGFRIRIDVRELESS